MVRYSILTPCAPMEGSIWNYQCWLRRQQNIFLLGRGNLCACTLTGVVLPAMLTVWLLLKHMAFWCHQQLGRLDKVGFTLSCLPNCLVRRWQCPILPCNLSHSQHFFSCDGEAINDRLASAPALLHIEDSNLQQVQFPVLVWVLAQVLFHKTRCRQKPPQAKSH